jgi:hypothetical protein
MTKQPPEHDCRTGEGQGTQSDGDWRTSFSRSKIENALSQFTDFPLRAFSVDEACPQQSMKEVRDQEIMFEDQALMNVIELGRASWHGTRAL